MPAPKERTSIKVQSERAVLAAVRLPTSNYDTRDPFAELASLAEQAGAVVVGTLEQHMERPVAGTFMGSGKVKELRELCDRLKATLVIFDHDLSPRQLSNIEEVVERKIVDRSELILDIFASRATTTEARLQVELAQLEYTYPRLRAMWDHLERIVGAGGMAGIGTRGPGEQQLEIDRRLAQKKRLALRDRLSEIEGRKRRMVAARNVDHFTVGIVGYTNAGKSTLFNTLTAGGAYADDRLFATLVTRTRDWDVGGGSKVMLSDTVGFVRDLPHNLIASFKATLEEALHANVLLIVLDVSDPAAELQYDTVNATLDELFKEQRESERRAARAGDEAAATWQEPRRVLLLNKVDRLSDNAPLLVWERRVPGCIPISARDAGSPGLLRLRAMIHELAQGGERTLRLVVGLRDSRTIDTLEKRGQVHDRVYNDDNTVTMHVTIGQRVLDQIASLGGRFRVLDRDSSRAVEFTTGPAPAWKKPAADEKAPRRAAASTTNVSPPESRKRR